MTKTIKLMAIDTNISDRIRAKYENMGYKMVYKVKDGVPDEVWIEDAVMNHNIDLILSKDLDIPNFLDKNGFDDIEWKDE